MVICRLQCGENVGIIMATVMSFVGDNVEKTVGIIYGIRHNVICTVTMWRKCWDNYGDIMSVV